jgi:hypothetical protein
MSLVGKVDLRMGEIILLKTSNGFPVAGMVADYNAGGVKLSTHPTDEFLEKCLIDKDIRNLPKKLFFRGNRWYELFHFDSCEVLWPEDRKRTYSRSD